MSELGQALREARESKGLSLEDLQQETKIQKRYLQAIEDGDYSQLPGEFYSRAFIKNYAEALDLDFNELANEYTSEIPKTHREKADMHTMPPQGADEFPAAKTLKRSQNQANRWSSFLNKAIVTVIILIIMVLIYILVARFWGAAPDQGTQNQPNESGVTYSGSSSEATDQGESGEGSSNNGSSGNSSSSAEDQSGSSDPSSQKQSLELEGTQGKTSTYTLSDTSQFSVEIAAKGGKAAWFSATDEISGKQIEQGTASEAEKKTFQIDAKNVQKLKLSFGNVPHTVLKINGKTFEFPNQRTIQDIIINYKK